MAFRYKTLLMPNQMWAIYGILIIVYFSYMHPLLRCSVEYNVLIPAWGIVFLFSNVYFVFFIILTCAVVFYDLCNCQKEIKTCHFSKESTNHLRKYLRLYFWILIRSFLYSAAILILSIVPILPRLDYSLQWGKIYYTGALTSILLNYGFQCPVSIKVLEEYTPLEAILILCLLLNVVFSITGITMFTLRMLFSLQFSAICISIMSMSGILIENRIIHYPKLYLLSIYSWLDLDKISVGYSDKLPSLKYIIFAYFIITAVNIMIVLIKDACDHLRRSRRVAI